MILAGKKKSHSRTLIRTFDGDPPSRYIVKGGQNKERKSSPASVRFRFLGRAIEGWMRGIFWVMIERFGAEVVIPE